jgi:hypothetical protein
MTELMQMTIDKLGVKVGEIFKIKDEDGEILYGNYYINEKGIMINANQETRINVLWQPLLIGEYQIVKLSFKPEHAEKYYFVNKYGEIGWENWIDYEIDYYRFNAKNCFRTEKEITEEDKKRIVTEMKREYENG